MSIKIARAKRLSKWGRYGETFADRVRSLGNLVDVLTAAQIAYAVDHVCEANWQAGRRHEVELAS